MAFVMLFSFMSFGDSWTETFDDQTSNSYSATTYDINGRTWTCSDAGNFSYANSTMGSPAFTINDDKANAHITTPALNTCGTVSFKYAYKNGDETNVFNLQKSTDGSTWTDVDIHVLGASANLTYQDYSFDVNDAATSIYIRVLSDNQNAHLFIEDFSVTDYSSGSTPLLTWNETTFNEASANDGSIDNTISLTLTNETFTTSLGQLTENTDYTVANVPAGLTCVVATSSSTEVSIGLSGNATNHADADDIANLTVTFLDAAFTGGDASAVTNSSKSDLVVDFIDGTPTATLDWDATGFTEAAANDGSITDVINLSLTNETWSHSGEDLISGTDYGVTNLPSGLTVSINAYSSTAATISISGNADSHTNADDVSDLTIAFFDAAFTGGDANAVATSTKTDLTIDFDDPAATPELSWSTTTFVESTTNDGSISTIVDLTLAGEDFATVGALVENTDYTVANVPAGLTVDIVTTSTTVGSISLTGNATSHLNSDDISNLEITFTDAAFVGANASGVLNSSKTDLIVDFNDPYATDLVITEISYNPPESGTDSLEFIEIYNNGVNTVNLENYYFDAISNPFGDVTLNSNEYILVSRDSLAIDNTFGVSSHNLLTTGLSNTSKTIKLLNPAGGIVDSVTYDDGSPWPLGADGQGHSIVLCDYNSDNSLPENWKISTNYVDTNAAGDKIWASPMASDVVCSLAPSIDWSTTTFNEDAADDGSISTVVDLTLTDDEFATIGTLVEGTDYTVANVPAGLTEVIEVTTATTATISLTGNAVNHAANDDINNLSITFNNSTFLSDYAENVANYSKTDLVIDYIGVTVPVLTWTNTTFVEAAANDGSIDNTTPLALNLTDETFVTVGTLTENTDYTVANVPAGLTVEITTTDANNAEVILTGNATAHENINDVSDLTITFLDAAFSGTDASIVQNSSNNTIAVDFNDAPAIPELTWNETSFTEDVANDGSFSTDISLTLTNETFAVSGVDLTQGTHYTVANVPAGLTVNINAYTSTAASITLVGNATSHVSADNISNLSITFLDAAFTNSTAVDVLNSSNDTIKVNFLDPYIIPDLVITEIMYNPAESGTDTTEFIEIYNNDVNAINLNGYYLEGVTYTFGNITLNSGDFIVVAYSTSVMMNTFGVSTLEWISGGLSNSGEPVTLYNPNGDVVDVVSYDDTATWPNADGSGHSIVLCDVTSDNNVDANWTISTNYVGENADGNRIWASPMSADNVCSLTPSIDWSATTFVEATANDGSIETVVDLTLTDDEFATIGNLVSGIDFYVNNVPAGLTVEITSTSTTAATIALTGNAVSHENADDIANLEITFTDSAFVSGFATNITNYSKTDLVVDFDDMVSVNTIDGNNGITIYPNPTTGIFTVNGNGITKVVIADVTGKTIITSDVNKFDLSKENNGIYFVKVYYNNSVKIQKLILNR